MAIVKFINSECPMNNIVGYVTRDEATEQKLISGIECSPDTALEEFRYVKRKFNKENGRTYCHIVQSFSPDDNITPEVAHEIGLKFAEYFPDFQILVATHYNTEHIHNHLILNSVNYKNGKKFHQTAQEMMRAKEYSNKLCLQYGLSVTEPRTRCSDNPKWKQRLRNIAVYALENTCTKEGFIEFMEMHGYKVKWEDKYKYITFTTPEGYKCRDNKLFDERLLKDNLEIYFALGGCESELVDQFCDYKTPEHNSCATMTTTSGLLTLLGDLLCIAPPEKDFESRPIKELSPFEKMQLEKILGKKISPEAYAYYSAQDDEQTMGFYM